jgi:hypothetical protein
MKREIVVWRKDAKKYVARGMGCVLWGRSVTTMSRDDLIAFIGFLDELATIRARKAPRATSVQMGTPDHPENITPEEFIKDAKALLNSPRFWSYRFPAWIWTPRDGCVKIDANGRIIERKANKRKG